MVVQQKTKNSCVIACFAELSKRSFDEVYNISNNIVSNNIPNINTWDQYIQSIYNGNGAKSWLGIVQSVSGQLGLSKNFAEHFLINTPPIAETKYYLLDKDINGIALLHFYLNKSLLHAHALIVKRGRLFEVDNSFPGSWLVRNFGESMKQYHNRYINENQNILKSKIDINLYRVIRENGELVNLSKQRVEK